MEYTGKYINTLKDAIALYRGLIVSHGQVDGASATDLEEVVCEEWAATNRLDDVKVKQESMTVGNIEEYRRYFLTEKGFASLFMQWAKESENSPKDEWGKVADELRKLRRAINEKMVAMAKILIPKNEPLVQGVAIPQKKSGKKIISFADCLKVENKSQYLQTLHNKINGQSKDVIISILNSAIANGHIINRPSHSAFKVEFGDLVPRATYNRRVGK